MRDSIPDEVLVDFLFPGPRRLRSTPTRSGSMRRPASASGASASRFKSLRALRGLGA